MAKYRKKALMVTAVRADRDQYITTLEGVTEAKRGDYIVTGVDNEQWAVKPKWFTPSYTHIKDDTYQRNPQVLEAVQIAEPNVISTPTGDIKGDKGDYKVTGTKGEQWFVKPDIFDKTYDKVKGGKSNMKTELQKAIDQIGLDTVSKSMPVGATLGNCDLHGMYMVGPEQSVLCPVCPALPDPNGTPASKVEHFIAVRDAISPASGTNPGQKINPLGV